MARTILVIGASRGIGEAVARHFAERGDQVFSVSRSKSAHGTWIQADLATPEGIASIGDTIGDAPVDALLFTGGVWEQGAFTSDYDFHRTSYQENLNTLSVNLLAPIEVTRSLAANLSRAEYPCAIYLGSTSGLENHGSPEVANTASKFGLRGAIQAMAGSLAKEGIRFCVINPANVATPEVLSDIEDGTFDEHTPIPLGDVVMTIEFVLNLSADTHVGDINLFQADRHR